MRQSAAVLLLTAIIVSVIIAGIAIASDSPPSTETIPSWAVGTGIISGTLGGPAFAVWFSWYMTTKRVPSMERRYAEQIEASEKRHADHVGLLISDFRADLKELWKYKREDDFKFSDILGSLDKSIGLLTEEVKKRSCEYARQQEWDRRDAP
jgi:hypothetical protein